MLQSILEQVLMKYLHQSMGLVLKKRNVITCNYLIVGGNSFIGINLALGLLKQGQNVKVFSRHINNFPQNIINEVEFIKGDLANVEDIYKALVNVDIIIYLAATSNVATSIEDVFEDINNSFFLNFMESAKDFLLKNCISIFRRHGLW